MNAPQPFFVFVTLAFMAADVAAAEPEIPLLAPGRFGNALDARESSLQASSGVPYSRPPITVECWVMLLSKGRFNVFVANEPKESATHWELYSYAQSGVLSLFLPGYTPSEILSARDICDRRWHYVVMRFDSKIAELYVDGQRVVRQVVIRRPGMPTRAGPISFGAALFDGGEIGCDGLVDDVRISDTLRPIVGVPQSALSADEHTIGLWSFDKCTPGKGILDASRNVNHLAFDTRSLDDIDRESYKAGPSPLDSKADKVLLADGILNMPAALPRVSLDGSWQLMEGGTAATRLVGDWNQPMAAVVPGSVHTALAQAGLIPHPFAGRNQELARPWSFKTYWYKKTFPRPPQGRDRTLVFHGVCNRCTVWLNGKELGQHEGMFTRIEYPLAGLLNDTNTLIVKLDPALEWQNTVVFNNSYGWHYSKFPPLGIWRSVEIRGEPAVKLRSPYVATRDAEAGRVDLVTSIAGPESGWSGKLLGAIAPDNFPGEQYHFEVSVSSKASVKDLHLAFDVPNPQLWWPIDLGRSSLYRLKLAFLPENGGDVDVQQVTFGIRTIEMAAVHGRRRPKQFNWTFVVNGRPTFIKGAGWCTPDAMMDFSRARYDRLLTLAASQHVQMLRAWGSGMVETDDFYDLCDRKGILVMQEWPTAWNSHNTQPFDLLEQTVREGTLRLRSHPSLAIYTGGNESGAPFGKAIDMMGRLCTELDGTRAFHRGEPFGGSVHDYDIYWGGGPLDHAFTMQAVFYGEFGIASYPCYESVQRFLPVAEKALWPPPVDKSFAYHTPIFNTAQDLDRQTRMSRFFTEGKSMEKFIVGTQLAQAVGVRHALERARTRWPDCTGALYYKLNDNSPAASWSTIDWYGVPKISHYLIRSSFAPLIAVTLFPAAATHGHPLTAPVFLLDDADALKDTPWQVVVRAYDATLKALDETRFAGRGSIKQVVRLGDFRLTASQTRSTPLLVVTDVLQNDVSVARNYYFTNFEPVKDCLFKLPKTRLAMEVHDGKATVRNVGSVAAVGVEISDPGNLDVSLIDDNYFWLDPGETRTVAVHAIKRLLVQAWNTER